MSFSTIIVAAGRGQRMGFDKLLAPLRGRPVLWWSVEAFLTHPQVDEVLLVCPASRYEDLQQAAPLSYLEKLRRVEGGAQRHHSVLAGLQALSAGTSHCAVHDGARPLISHRSIDLCYAQAQQHGAATLAQPITATLKRVDPDHFTQASVSREQLWMMETPQLFGTTELLRAYQTLMERGEEVTDEVSALQLIGIPTKVIANPDPNPKITYPADLPLAAQLLSPPSSH